MTYIKALEEFQAGQGTVGATSQPLAAVGETHSVQRYVIVKADLGNSNDVFVGPSIVTAGSGFRLDAGEVTPPIAIDELSKVYVIGGAASQGYSWLAI
jgi:hypothetical protein